MTPRSNAWRRYVRISDSTRSARSDRERAARNGRLGEVEVERDRAATAQVDCAGRVEERRELREPVAAPRRSDCRELGAYVGGERVDAHRMRALEREQPALQAPTGRPVAAELVRLAAAGGHDAMARDDEREAVGGAEAARGAGGAWPPGARRETAVGLDVAPARPCGSRRAARAGRR